VRQLMLLFVLALAATATTAPLARAAAPVRASGVVLSISSERHALRIVDGPRIVDASYRGTLPVGVSAGAQITFSTVARRAFRFVVDGHVDHVLVSGTVVRDGPRLALRLSDGGLVALPKGRHFKLGAFAHVALRFRHAGAGGSSPTGPGSGATPKKPAAIGCAKADCTFDVTGVVTAVDDSSGAVTVAPLGGGAPLTAQPGEVSTDGVFVGDFVEVTGTQAADSGSYTLLTLDELPGCDTADCTLTLDGTVDDIQARSFSVTDDLNDEYPFNATAAQLATLQIDDSVHIVAVEDPTTGDYQVTTVTVVATAPPAPPLQ
jgi:hypothetical protein